jgi:hypothetical protein
LILGARRIEQPLDDYAVTPETIQFAVAAMDADFGETESLQKGGSQRSPETLGW